MSNGAYATMHLLPNIYDIPRHFTASAVVLSVGHILLVHHRRIGAWLPPGGHIEELEMPHQAAVRETFEETGVSVEVLSDHFPDTRRSDAFFLPSPLCMHSVKAVEKGKELYHMDIAYLCRPLKQSAELPAIVYTDEVKEARWFKLEQLSDILLAHNVVEVIQLALKRQPV